MRNPNIELVGVDKEIYSYLNLYNPKSFLLFAGAGSGKTRTLVNVLQEIKNNNLQTLIENGQKVAVITYTNAASNEIQHRLEYDPIFTVSTIHSFIWELIKPFTSDIKDFIKVKLRSDIDVLTTKISKARDKNGKTALANARSLKSKQKRLDGLAEVESFTYSPTSNKTSKGTLNHSEVIIIGSIFIADQKLMQSVLINRYPILLIDESQDTNKVLLEAFISVQENNKNKFSLGLFGDMMQRIYSGGKNDLTTSLPPDWETPAKIINYRCPKRVITLINNIRKGDDQNVQVPKEDAIDGFVRLFIVDSNTTDKLELENKIRFQMAMLTHDEDWNIAEEVKTLTLEHDMAASRGGFDEFLLPLSSVSSLRDAALNGTSKNINFITSTLLPFIDAVEKDDSFEVARIIKSGSLLISDSNQSFLLNPIGTLKDIDSNVVEFKKILVNGKVTLHNVLSTIQKFELLSLPDELLVYLSDIEQGEPNEPESDTKLLSDVDKAWGLALNSSIGHVKNYAKYVNETLGYATHQGVKGLEYKRVMAVLDDKFKGFLFDYEKLFGAKDLTKKDIENEDLGKDSALSRTRRLFYVICSRAEQSLAVVAYSNDPIAIEKTAIESEWFSKDEIVLI
ncbi:UvrD-helicase domain-containing protein [Colwellia psychrerythraea]|uniref:Putative ATP-dependent DNA helicase n=1 Tax=Colwellia psychrerythraea (strain 34H / ATCC BAA-681) TaxID=167879 RepID=Q481Y4_COLP3|nr:UvrD-helicase domain-containing protein [Colwellia psychrerythraea]AAZ26646.1 putative ATP-dependent DNA helicase [Colwellia psychrerythraea 34H]